MGVSEFQHSDLTEKIIGCAMKVHTIMGNGFQEVIYQRSLAIEMQKQGLEFEREKEIVIHYEGHQVGTRRVDFLVAGCILVELKAVSELEKTHFAQAINYLEAFKLDVGLLINFGETRLHFKRLFKPKHRQTSPSCLS